MSAIIRMIDLKLGDKRVFIREDLNVPLDNGRITSDERILRALPSIQLALKQKARVMILSHLGRPTEGEFDEKYSLAPVAKALSEHLKQEVRLVKDWLQGIEVDSGQVVLCENVRFNVGEKENDVSLARKMAALCDVFVMDAFATAHRAQASTVGIAEYAPIACAGPLLMSEIDTLTHALYEPKRPLTAIVGGSKVSTKIQLLDNLLDKVDQLIVGGGIANTFLKARGFNIGKSLCEDQWLDTAKIFWQSTERRDVDVPLPVDVVVAKNMSKDATAEVKRVDELADDDCIFDIGPETAAAYAESMAAARTIVWNGPVGVFELPAFAGGTEALAKAIAASQAYSIAGGGDTLAALAKFGVHDKISYISTGGGAFLELMEGKTLPALTVLEKTTG